MAQFDIGTLANITGNGGGVTAVVGGAFGVPGCMIDLANGALASLIPSPILAVIQLQIEQARAAARAAIKKIFKSLAVLTGIYEYDTESGTLQFKSIGSLGAIDSYCLCLWAFVAILSGSSGLGFNWISSLLIAISSCDTCFICSIIS